MRIAAISTLSGGGAATAALRLTQALRAYGHDCAFFALESGGQPDVIPLVDQLNSLDSHWYVPTIIKHGQKLAASAEATDACCELFSDQYTPCFSFQPLPEALTQAEVIHLHWVAGTLFSPDLLRAFQGKKVIWTLHDMNALTGGCHYHTHCKAFMEQCGNCPVLERLGPDDTSRRCFALKCRIYPLLNPTIVGPSQWLANLASQSALLRDCCIHTIPYALDLSSFQPLARGPLKEKYGLRLDTVVVLAGVEYLGNPRKNTTMVFDSLRLLAAERPDAPLELVLFGHGAKPDLPFPIHHQGYVSDPAILAELYNLADVFIHPSRLDNLPNTLCEAQSCGTPVISTDAGGSRETFISGKSGFLLPENSAEALARLLSDILGRPEQLTAMREAARAFACERFAPEKVAALYTSVFEHATPARGLETTDPLYTELMHNQFSSLATHLRMIVADTERQREILRQDHEALRWKVKHPFHWLFQKVFGG